MLFEEFFYILIFLLSCSAFYYAGGWIITGVRKISYKFGWKEFILSFLVVAFVSSLPNFFVGISSALQGIPELSFGDVVGGNLIALTLAAPLALLFSLKKEIVAESRTVQWSLFFTLGAAVLPPILVYDGMLGRIDGMILIGFFILYIVWLFHKRERFMLHRDDYKKLEPESTKLTKRDIYSGIAGLVLIIIAAQGIVHSATFFAEGFGLSLVIIGILIVGVGNALPQIYFATSALSKGENWMLLGGIMGSVIIPATLVLGVVSLIHPINIDNIDIALASRLFLVVAALLFFFVLKTSQKLVVREAFMLFSVYILFLGYVFLIY